MRPWGWILIVVVAATNVLLFVSNGILVKALDELQDSGVAGTIAEFRAERQSLAQERLRIAERTGRLDEAIRKLGELRGAPTATEEASVEEASFDLEAEFPDLDLSRRPVPRDIPEMDPEVFRDLLRYRDTLPRELRGQLLLVGDVEQVLASPVWNPDGRSLNESERAELQELLDDYRYFARLSHVERFKSHVEPEIERLRAAGAYIEYPENEAPPNFDGVRISHSEPSDREGYKRAFYFPPQDYPALAHHERVERERGLETFLQIYNLINEP